jgi:hypothetical protein
MFQATVIELAVKPRLLLNVDGKPYELAFPLAAVAAAEEKLGRSLKSPSDWFTVNAKELPVMLEAGLSNTIPPEEIQAICDRLDPEMYSEVVQAIGALAWPKFTQRYLESIEKLKGKSAPKAESAGDL